MKIPNVKKVIRDSVSSIKEKYAILLSSGIDSRALFFESIEQKKNFVCYTFRLPNVEGQDFVYAKKLCSQYKIKHIEITLPISLDTLIEDIKKMKLAGATKKTDYECFWPMLYVYKQVDESTILTGLGADGHFCISKKGMIHFKNNIDEFRKKVFGNTNYCQMHLHRHFCENKKIINPFLSLEMIYEFDGTKWDDINTPKQKQTIIDAYKKEFEGVKLFKHTNYHLGDSGISNHFKKLLSIPEFSNRGFKSTISIFNRIDKINSTNELKIVINTSQLDLFANN